MKMYSAAVQIQKTFRGYVTRKAIKKWHAAATAIQKVVRGWFVRYRLPDVMHEYYDQMCFDCYTNSATKIQAHWKGHSVSSSDETLLQQAIDEYFRFKKLFHQIKKQTL